MQPTRCPRVPLTAQGCTAPAPPALYVDNVVLLILDCFLWVLCLPWEQGLDLRWCVGQRPAVLTTEQTDGPQDSADGKGGHLLPGQACRAELPHAAGGGVLVS